MTILHVFDMDGTLLCGTTASLAIARKLGCEPELVQLEASLISNVIDTRRFAAEITRLWRALTPADVADAFRSCRWIDGIAEVMTDIKARGEHSLVVTMSPDFFADHLRTFGVDVVLASRFPPLPFRASLDPAGILAPADKVTAVKSLLVRHGLGPHQCVAYGDSSSDVPLFKHLPFTVAINASDELRSLTGHHYDGDDLRVAYRSARAILAGKAKSLDGQATEPGSHP